MDPVILTLAWILTVKACAGGVCKTLIEREVGTLHVCQARQETILARVPGSPPALWRLPRAKSVAVTVECVVKRGFARKA